MPDAQLKPAMDRKAKGLLVYTDETCFISGRTWPGIPLLLWPEGIDEEASDYFRDLMVIEDMAASSVKEYAKVIRKFLSFCRNRGRKWSTVDDAFLTIWREHMRLNLDVGRVNYNLSIVFRFYAWAQEHRRLRYHVGVYTDLPPEMQEYRFPISAKESRQKSRNGQTYLSWTTPLLLTVRSVSTGKRHTPTEEEIRRIHEAALEKQNGERDTLIFSWAEETGVRRFELLQLRKSDLPTVEQVYELIECDEPWTIYLRRKGRSNVEAIAVLPDLLIRTWDYINATRQEIVTRHRAENIGYVEPDEVFLSNTYTAKTRGILQANSVTNIGADAFRKAGVRSANIHRMRAKYAIGVVEMLVEAMANNHINIAPGSSWTETILTMAAERMGHASPLSLRPYLNYVLHRRIQASEAVKAHAAAGRLRQTEQRLAAAVRHLSNVASLQEVANLILSRKRADRLKAVAALRDMAAFLEAEA